MTRRMSRVEMRVVSSFSGVSSVFELEGEESSCLEMADCRERRFEDAIFGGNDGEFGCRSAGWKASHVISLIWTLGITGIHQLTLRAVLFLRSSSIADKSMQSSVGPRSTYYDF